MLYNCDEIEYDGNYFVQNRIYLPKNCLTQVIIFKFFIELALGIYGERLVQDFIRGLVMSHVQNLTDLQRVRTAGRRNGRHLFSPPA